MLVADAQTRTVCEAIGVSRSSLLRFLAGSIPAITQPGTRRVSPRRIPDHERQAILDVLYSERFADLAVPQIHAQLLDEGQYLCSPSTMYRLLRENAEVRERRSIARHPELLAPE
jgi:putative transposase